MLHRIILGLALCSTSFFGCVSTQALQPTVPDWVMTSPVLSGYYVGVGSASKLDHPLNADAIAKQNARDNMSAEIRVQVNASSTVTGLQVDDWASQGFSQRSTTTTEEDLEGFELVATYCDEKACHAYYRLSRATHARIQAEKKQAALTVAKGHFEQAQTAKQLGKIQQAVDAAIRGLEALSPFADEPLVWEDEQGVQIHLLQELTVLVSDCLEGVTIDSEENEVVLDIRERYRREVPLRVSLDGVPLTGVSLDYTYSRGTLPMRGSVETNSEGQATVILEKFEPGTKESTLEVKMNSASYVESLPTNHPWKRPISSLQGPPERVRITLAPIELTLRVDERAFGKKRDAQVLENTFQQALAEANAKLMPSKHRGGYVLSVESDARPGGSGQGFVTVYVDIVATLTAPDGHVIDTFQKTNIKGVQLDLLRATDAAYGKASQEILDNMIPDMIRRWHES